MKFIASRIPLVIVFLIVLTALVGYARGYRLNLDTQKVVPTGILVASSYPDGAKIFINGDLHGATNSNITLPPGGYDIEIRKEAFSSWKKHVTIKGELIVKTDALLFPQNPSLSPITSLGVVRAIFFPNTEKTIILSENPNREPATSPPDEVQKDGVYLLDNANRPINLFNPLKLLAQKSALGGEFDFADTHVTLSPDGKQLLLSILEEETIRASYLMSTADATTSPFDVTRSRRAIEQAWEAEQRKTLQKILETFKDPLPQVASDSFDIVQFSPDQRKILYRANKNTTLPLIIKPRLIGTNQTEEVRELTKDSLYVYDKTEDKNFLIAEAVRAQDAQNYMWYPDSSHVVIRELSGDPKQETRQIAIVDYDGTNKRTVYSGPYEEDFLGVTADGKLLVLANLNPRSNKRPDIYAVGIR